MSEPITRAEFRDFLIHKERVDLLHPGTSPALIFDSWCEQHRTESASPPRALVGITGPVLPYESGPGQPIDICERLKQDANSVLVAAEDAARAGEDISAREWRRTADLEREAAAEIRRLRDIIDQCQEAAGIPADQAEDYFTVPALIADKIVELEDRAAGNYRAGIEAAARLIKVAENYVKCSSDAACPRISEKMESSESRRGPNCVMS